MSSYGQAALSIGGAAIGFIVSGGNPAVAAWGLRLDSVPGLAVWPSQGEPAPAITLHTAAETPGQSTDHNS